MNGDKNRTNFKMEQDKVIKLIILQCFEYATIISQKTNVLALKDFSLRQMCQK